MWSSDDEPSNGLGGRSSVKRKRVHRHERRRQIPVRKKHSAKTAARDKITELKKMTKVATGPNSRPQNGTNKGSSLAGGPSVQISPATLQPGLSRRPPRNSRLAGLWDPPPHESSTSAVLGSSQTDPLCWSAPTANKWKHALRDKLPARVARLVKCLSACCR